jgi:hypothetical protein
MLATLSSLAKMKAAIKREGAAGDAGSAEWYILSISTKDNDFGRIRETLG